MKRVQNWRDYLDSDNQQYKEKISKKKKRKSDEDLDNSDTYKDKPKGKRK